MMAEATPESGTPSRCRGRSSRGRRHGRYFPIAATGRRVWCVLRDYVACWWTSRLDRFDPLDLTRADRRVSRVQVAWDVAAQREIPLHLLPELCSHIASRTCLELAGDGYGSRGVGLVSVATTTAHLRRFVFVRAVLILSPISALGPLMHSWLGFQCFC